MRPIILIILFLFAFFGQVFGQTDTGTVYKNLKTKKVQTVNLALHIAGDTTYTVNGKEVSKRIYEKYSSKWDNMETCCPCIFKAYNKGRLTREGVACVATGVDAGVGWFKDYYKNGNIKLSGTYKENPTGDWKNLCNRGYCNIPHGQWTYFSENGDTLYSEFWDNGEFIKQVPEQNKVEIWKVELMLDGQKVDKEQLIPKEQVKNLKIIPKYKNRNTNSELYISFECVSENCDIRYCGGYTIESLKSIDVDYMLSLASATEDKVGILIFELNVHSGHKWVSSFFLKIEK